MAIPNTNMFSLQDVCNEVGGDDLIEAFSLARADLFDPSYEGSKNNLLNFRNYAAGYDYDWLGYISWSFDYDNLGLLYFIAYNGSTKNGQTSTMYWQTRDIANTVLDSGSVVSGTLDAGASSYPTDSFTGAYSSIWGMVTGGSWIRMF